MSWPSRRPPPTGMSDPTLQHTGDAHHRDRNYRDRTSRDRTSRDSRPTGRTRSASPARGSNRQPLGSRRASGHHYQSNRHQDSVRPHSSSQPFIGPPRPPPRSRTPTGPRRDSHNDNAYTADYPQPPRASHTIVRKPQPPTDPSLRPNTGIPIKGAATHDFADTTLPKNFQQPLTCFYWNMNKCSKSDAACIYAHYHTGVIAQAPVNLGPDAVAGRTAKRESKREQEMRDREACLDHRERQLSNKLDAKKAEWMGKMRKAFDESETAVGDARFLVTMQRDDVEIAINENAPEERLLTTLDDVIGTIAGIESKLRSLKQELEERSS